MEIMRGLRYRFIDRVMRSHFEIFKTKRGKQPWRWRLVAANGEIVASSEGYASHENAIRGMKTLVRVVNESLSRVVNYQEVPDLCDD
jgi:uncharacterized protein YegP (UPF0339 family)